MTIPAKYDIDYALKEAIDKLDKKIKNGFKVSNPGGNFIPIMSYRDEIYVGGSRYHMSDVRAFLIAEGGGHIYDLKERKAHFVEVKSWDRRNKAKNAADAMEFISAHMAKRFEYLSDKDFKEIEEFAGKFNIPFSIDLMSTFRSAFDDFQPQWNSSSAYC